MPTIPAATLTTAQLPAYQHVTPPVFDTIAKGRESIIRYNGLVLNDRLRPDRYYITEIDGLGGADIRDNRQVMPQDHGEIPYDAYWGGNTMTITGHIEAGNFYQAKRMERDLEAAFGTLIESPMKFNWWDVRDDFSDSITSAAFWQPLSGSVAFPGDGTMRFTSTSNTLAYYALRQYIDHIVTARFVAPAMNSTTVFSVVGKCSSSAVFARAGVTNSALFVSAGVAGTSQSYVIAAGVAYWIQLVFVGDTVAAHLFEQDPFLTNAAPVATASLSGTTPLMGSSAQSFGAGAQGFAGVWAQGTTQVPNIVVQDFRVDGLWPSDMVQNVRSIASPSVKAVMQTSLNKYKADFQLTVRASNPRWTAPWTQTAQSVPLLSSSPSLTFGRVYPRTYPLRYNVPINALGQPSTQQGSFALPIVSVFNKGNWIADTMIVIYGGITSPSITNLTTGQTMLLDCVIASGDFITINSVTKSLTNAAGNDVFSVFDPGSVFIKLIPNENELLLSGSPQSAPYFTCQFANTWK